MVDQPRTPLGERARFVERQHVQPTSLLQVDAALDQDAPPRAGRQRTHDRDRRRNDERARAGDNKQHQRPVRAVQPIHAQQHRSTNGDRQRNEEDNRRVDTRKTVDEALGGSTLALRILDRMNDACQHGVRGGRSDLQLEASLQIDRAGEHLVTRPLLHRHAFTGDGGLVHSTAPRRYATIQGKAFSGLNPHDLPHAHQGGIHAFPGCVGAAPLCDGRRQIQQTLDGVAGAIHRAGLDEFRQRIQGHDHGGFGPFTDHKGTTHRDRHQGIDVQLAPKQGIQALSKNGRTRKRDGCGRQHHAHAPPHRRVGHGKRKAFSDPGQY